jgi:hypothetical protein
MPEIKQDIRTATLIVAAVDSLNRNMADYVCDQVADDVEINAALAALPAEGGRVILLEGQYVLANPVIIPDNDIILQGQGWSTFINGNNLLTGNHAVVLSTFSNCVLRDFSVRTEAGGGKTSHCIFIEDGANDFLVENIYVEDSDSDGIHVEGTSISRGKITRCFIEGADDHGIQIAPDALDITQYFHIWENHIFSAGIDGIHLANCAGHQYMIIEENSIGDCVGNGIGATYLFESTVANNYIRGCNGDGIELTADCDNNLIDNNYCNSNGGYGINIVAASCDGNRVLNNKLIGNTTGAIADNGTITELPFIFIPVPNPNTNIGTHPATQLTDGLAVVDRIELYIPIEFQELVRAEAILVPGGSGNLRRSVATNWGMIGSGEVYNSDVGAIAAGEVAVTMNHLEFIDISAAFTGVAPVSQGDSVGIEFTRHGNHANDTVNADCYLLGVRIQYV